MAKVMVEEDSVDIRVSLLERLMLAERSRKVPLARIRGVDPHPRVMDMMLHWSDQSSVWLCGVSAYDGHIIPSARNPSHTLAIELDDEELRRIYVEIDDESTEHAAERIRSAVRAYRGQGFDVGPATPDRTPSHEMQRALAKMLEEDERRLRALEEEEEEEEEDDDEEDVRLRDPLMQGSLPPPPPRTSVVEPPVEQDRDLARLGGFLVAMGSVGVLTGTTIVAAGMIPGLLAVGAGAACGVLGGVALAVVANHKQ